MLRPAPVTRDLDLLRPVSVKSDLEVLRSAPFRRDLDLLRPAPVRRSIEAVPKEPSLLVFGDIHGFCKYLFKGEGVFLINIKTKNLIVWAQTYQERI